MTISDCYQLLLVLIGVVYEFAMILNLFAVIQWYFHWKAVLKSFMFYIFLDSKIKWNAYSLTVSTADDVKLKDFVKSLTSLFQK